MQVTESRIYDAYENELERERRVEFGCAFFKQFEEVSQIDNFIMSNPPKYIGQIHILLEHW